MTRYAENTEVPVARSKEELDRLLTSNGATQRAYFSDSEQAAAVVQFKIEGRMIRFKIRYRLPMVFAAEPLPRGWSKWSASKREQWCAERGAQDERAAWRRLLLVTKAKFELILAGDETIERAFLADILLPDGGTVEDHLKPQLKAAYDTGEMPPLLPAYGGK